MLALMGWAGFAFLVGWCWRAANQAPTRQLNLGWRWWLVTGLTLLSFRWRMIVMPTEFNPDEAHLIAGAITLRHDPAFWRSVDGITAGPLAFYPLLPATFSHGLTSFIIARLIGLAGLFGILVFTGEAVAKIAGTVIACSVVLPALAFLAFTTTPDFKFYSTGMFSEHRV
jgi:hypothetical protein